MTRQRLGAHLLLLLWAALVASSFPVAALFNPLLSTNLLVSLRFLLAGTILLLMMPERSWPGVQAGAIYTVLGLLLAAFFSIMFKALQYSAPLTLAALFVTQPLFAYLIAIAARIERFAWRRLSILLLAAGAALAIVSRGEVDRLLALKLGFGELIFLFGCVLSAAYNVLSRHASDQGLIPAAPLRTTCYSLLAGGLLVALGEILRGALPDFVATLSARDLVALGYLTLFTTLITFWILQAVTLRLSPSMVAAYGYLPPILVLYAELLLGLSHWHDSFVLATLLLAAAIWRLSLNEEARKIGHNF